MGSRTPPTRRGVWFGLLKVTVGWSRCLSMPQSAPALVAKGVALGRLDQADDELAAYDEVIERFGGSDDPAIAAPVAAALVAKGTVLRRLGRPDDAVSTFDQVIKQFGGSAEPKIAKLVALVLANKDAIMPRSERSRR